MKTGSPVLKILTLLLLQYNLPLSGKQPTATVRNVPPVLQFPEIGLDDTSTYRGYATRFYQDSQGNTLQIYIKQNEGRLVNIWADAANESISFTARDGRGQPAYLTWDSPGARLSAQGQERFVEYSLVSKTPMLELGHFVLNTMRLERDFQYFRKHMQPFASEAFIPQELTDLIDNLKRLPDEVLERHLKLLSAGNIEELYSRLVPQIRQQSKASLLVQQPTFDGKNHLSLELSVNDQEVVLQVTKDRISITSSQDQPIKLTVKIGTDSPPLTPLESKDIFNDEFFEFYERVRSEDEQTLRFRRLERQVKSMELMSSQEKLMAGLPNYATYFGRDMMMSALMLEPVVKPEMLEHVIASVLRKLKANGEVSHEEGLGGQAIRENAAKYNKLFVEYSQKQDQGDERAASEVLADMEKVLMNLQAVTENYHMVDDDFQLPVLTARYLTNSEISKDRKQEFLLSSISPGDTTSHLTLLLRNLIYVANVSRAYVTDPVAGNLISFRKLDEQRWHAGSWRDSAVGYANGRFAMDINAIWVPKALQSLEKIFAAFRGLGISIDGISIDHLQEMTPGVRGTELMVYAQNAGVLQEAIKTWRNVFRHFEIQLSPQDVQQRVRAKLAWLPQQEQTYWEKVITENAADKEGIEFLAISLDAEGQPIPIAHTDMATWLFLENTIDEIRAGEIGPNDVIKRLKMFVVPYPVGLFLEGVGPVVANDVYASPEIWESFKRDHYHSPRVVWGREVNLLFLGLARQIRAAHDSEGRIRDESLASYVRELRLILSEIQAAVEASGLQHNELWSYRIEGERLLPARYATTTDIQLWNLTDLAVQFMFDSISN